MIERKIIDSQRPIPMSRVGATLRVGVAGWSIPKILRRSPAVGATLLRHYAAIFDAVEINSSFYRPHRLQTYQRWSQTVPDDFRFAVKMPRAITHERKLVDCEHELDVFLAGVSGLGSKLAVLLVQLPPSSPFDAAVAAAFFHHLNERCRAHLVCEPRHPSWSTDSATAVLRDSAVTRVTADPVPAGCTPTVSTIGDDFEYLRLHGAPRTYYSSYSDAYLADLNRRLTLSSRARQTWCIFDNTAAGAAWGNAYAVA